MNKLDAVSTSVSAANPAGAEPLAPANQAAAEAAADGAAVVYQSGDVSLRAWRDADGKSFFSAGRTGGVTTGPRPTETRVMLAGMSIDPAQQTPPSVLPDRLRADADASLQIVQFVSQSLPGFREALEAKGAKVLQYLPDNAFVISAAPEAMDAVKALPFVRASMPMHGALKMPAALRAQVTDPNNDAPMTLSVMVIDEAVRAKVMAQLGEIGGKDVYGNGVGIRVTVPADKVAAVAALEQVISVNDIGRIEVDIDNARIQGGASFLEQNGSKFQGQGMKVHVFEGIQQAHPEFGPTDFRKAAIAIGNSASTWHGTCTAGEIAGKGVNPRAKGIVPHAQIFFTNYDQVMNEPAGSKGPNSRYGFTRQVMKDHDIDSQTASWGYTQVPGYTDRSKELDELIFDADLAITQSQSNTGTNKGRPQAWAKNVIPVTALYHFNNADPNDERWNGGSSTRDGTEKRIGRTLCGYYDQTFTTSDNSDYTEDFGGTSGATPMINGHINAMIQMFKEGTFAPALHAPDAWTAGQRPHAATTAALAIASAKQYAFSSAAAENNRYRQGWGFPDLRRLYQSKDKLFIVDESTALKTLESRTFKVAVGADEPELKVSLVWRDPAALATATKTQVNDIDLKVTAPDGTVYFGNVGLLDGNYSKPGGSPDRLDTVENVFIKNPAAGEWKIEVIGAAINQDGNVATPEQDSAFSLVALGGKKVADTEAAG